VRHIRVSADGKRLQLMFGIKSVENSEFGHTCVMTRTGL
jgi:hypothetical protein